MQVRVLTDRDSLQALSAAWADLMARSDFNEPTLSPLWMLAWWDVFGALDQRRLCVVTFWEGERLVGLAPLVSRAERYRRLLSFQRLELMASGESLSDEICSEYIGIIAERGAENQVAQAMAEQLSRGQMGDWDELALVRMRGDHPMASLLARALRARGLTVTLEVTDVASYVPLPRTWDSYVESLPSSRRYLVRRSLREFDKWAGGKMQLHRASDEASLQQGWQVLTSLHQGRWEDAGRQGVFASERFRSFHQVVMPKLLQQGCLDLSWLTVADRPVAVVYNLIWDGKVYFYQSGRITDVPSKVRPGIVLHAMLMQKAIESGYHEYDFLGGLTRYKMDLATATRPLLTLRTAKPSLAETGRRLMEVALEHARVIRKNMRRPLRNLGVPREETAKAP